MNDVLIAPAELRWPRRTTLKRALWSAAGFFALGGLYVGRPRREWFRIEKMDMRLPHLGRDLDGTTLVHLSDLHLSPIVMERYLRNCVRMVNELQPDFVALTGDFVTGPKHYVRRVAGILKDLHPRVATVACLGNHDYGLWHPGGLGHSRDLANYVYEQLSHADIFVMMNETRTFRQGSAAIQFVGLEDYWSDRFDPELAFEMARPDLPTVALLHNPDPAEAVARQGAQWILAGHKHGRELKNHRLADWIFPTRHKHYFAGRYRVDEASLYVNRGIGYARRVNINARPEIALFTLRPGE